MGPLHRRASRAVSLALAVTLFLALGVFADAGLPGLAGRALATSGYTITSSVKGGGGGTISPLGEKYFYSGDNQSYLVTPDPSWFIGDVTVDGTSVGPQGTVVFTNITADHSVEASFSVCAATGGKITQSGDWVVHTFASGTCLLYTSPSPRD